MNTNNIFADVSPLYVSYFLQEKGKHLFTLIKDCDNILIEEAELNKRLAELKVRKRVAEIKLKYAILENYSIDEIEKAKQLYLAELPL